jgi:hypothetical protein
MIRAALILGGFAFILGVGHARAQVIPWFDHLPMVPFPQGSGGGPPPTGNALLLVNNVDNVLLVDGSDNLCLVSSTTC